MWKWWSKASKANVSLCSGSTAKDRLQLILAHQRGSFSHVNMSALQKDLLQCVQVRLN